MYGRITKLNTEEIKHEKSQDCRDSLHWHIGFRIKLKKEQRGTFVKASGGHQFILFPSLVGGGKRRQGMVVQKLTTDHYRCLIKS